MTTNKQVYAGGPLKVGDKVGVRVHTDIQPGTVIKASAMRATVQLHSFKLANGPGSGEPDVMVVTPGGFAAHWEGRQRNIIDESSNAGECVITFRKNDKLNDQVGVWRRAGASGGLGKLPGVVYNGLVASYDYNS